MKRCRSNLHRDGSYDRPLSHKAVQVPISISYNKRFPESPSEATSLLSNSTASLLSGEEITPCRTFSGEQEQKRPEGIRWDESWEQRVESRRSGGGNFKAPLSGGNIPIPSGKLCMTPPMLCSLRVIGCLSLVVVVLSFWHGKVNDPLYENFAPAKWHWDHNIYVPTTEIAATSSDSPHTLIAQVVTGSKLGQLADISMRPNRAYARQWSIDYVRYDSGRSAHNWRACFEKVAVLNEIFDQHGNRTSSGKYPWELDAGVQYSFVVLLPADAVVVELDTNILNSGLSPIDKLVTIAGWNERKGLNSNSDILVFNLRHRHFEAVARRWLEIVAAMDMTCGDNNDLTMLVNAIAMVADEESEQLNHLIQPLQENVDGYVGDRIIKALPIAVPEQRASFIAESMQQSAMSVQSVVDSVCFRFFPKCEVLPAA